MDKLDKLVLVKICQYILINGDLKNFSNTCYKYKDFVRNVFAHTNNIKTDENSTFLCLYHYKIESHKRDTHLCSHCNNHFCQKTIRCSCAKCCHVDSPTFANLCGYCKSTCPKCQKYKPATQDFCGKKRCVNDPYDHCLICKQEILYKISQGVTGCVTVKQNSYYCKSCKRKGLNKRNPRKELRSCKLE